MFLTCVYVLLGFWVLSKIFQFDINLRGKRVRTFKSLTAEQIRQKREGGCNCGPGKRVDSGK
jgi:hypothetical protein